MRKLFKVVTIIATVMFASTFVACRNPNSGDDSSGSGSGSTGDNFSSSTTTNPFSGTVWKQSLNGELITVAGATTITFASSGKTVTLKNTVSQTYNYKIVDDHTAFFYYGNVTTTGFDFIIDSTNPNKATFSSQEFLKQ